MHLYMFDVDGTLVDSSKFDEECFLKAAEIVFDTEISSNWEEYSYATDAGILDEVIDKYNIQGDRARIHERFKQVFTGLISEHMSINPGDISEIKGSAEFIQDLATRDNVKVAIATGGWEEVAKLKLCKANIPIDGCVFASSSDHYDRTEIMKLAESRASGSVLFKSKTYFGDASWDKEACKILNYRFVLVGSRIANEIQIDNFQNKEQLLSLLGLL